MPPLRQRRDREQKGLLLREKRLPLRAVAGLYSEKTGGTYDATAVLDDTGESVRFRLEFDKGART